MAQLSEILQQEKQRTTEESFRKIYLYAEGSFLRAYEWSAWMCVRYIYKFSVTKRLIKSIDEPMVFVGFPITSLQKFIPEGSSCEQLNEKLVVITLSEQMMPVGEGVQDVMAQDFLNWKQSIPLKESKDRNKDTTEGEKASDAGIEGVPRLTQIMQRVLAFPIEQKSPLDCMIFLADIKKQIASII